MSLSRRSVKGLVLLAAGGLLVLFACAENQAQPPGAGDTRTVRGRIERFTSAPKGEVDGAVLDDGTWLHWPPHVQDRFTNVLSKGDRVRATGRTERGKKGDTRFEVESVTNLRTDETADNPDYANGLPLRGRKGKADRDRGPARVEGDVRTVRGRIERFTSAPKGEVDGAVLDDGTWLHWPPHMQDRFTNVLSKGDRVRATGRTERGKKGDTRFEVESVTNLRSNAKAENPDFVYDQPERVAAPRPADREERLRQLEEQLDQLRREIQRLRRER